MNGQDYGYQGRIHEIRKQYPQLAGEIYLDFAGTPPYPNSIIQRFSAKLQSNLYGNPHSRSAASEASASVVEQARLDLLTLFNADPTEYSVVFTANSTAAIKLVGEGLTESSRLLYLEDSHTSIVGLRALTNDYSVGHIKNFECDLLNFIKNCRESSSPASNLVSWPAQSNFAGSRYPSVKWIDLIQKDRSKTCDIYTLVDAASISSTSPLNLRELKPDFVSISLYKIFGFPDLGALLVKTDRGRTFFADRKYFGGGTLEGLTAHCKFMARHKDISTSLEDGTIPFHSILALKIAIEEFKRLYGNFNNISRHTSYLADNLYRLLSQLTHYNGAPVCVMYGTSLSQPLMKRINCGPIVTFNLKTLEGNWVGYSEVEKIAKIQNIHLRTGTLCNTGSNSYWTGINEKQVIKNYKKGHVCGDDNDIINEMPTGVIRVSVGACTTWDDINRFVEFIDEFFVIKGRHQAASMQNIIPTKANQSTDLAHCKVQRITIYPVKSCGGYNIPQGVAWKVTPEGLEWDREFCLVDLSNNRVLSLKKYPSMALLKPTIDREDLVIRYANESQSLRIPLYRTSLSSDEDTIDTKICGDSTQLTVYHSKKIINYFFSRLNVKCTLARSQQERTRNYKAVKLTKSNFGNSKTHNGTGNEPDNVKVGIANSSPILLVSKSSVEHLKNYSNSDVKSEIFRGNILLSSLSDIDSTTVNNDKDLLLPYAEDTWNELHIGSSIFQLLGPCRRCNMICVDPDNGQINSDPYKALVLSRKVRGLLLFGQHCSLQDGVGYIEVGDHVVGGNFAHQN